MIDNKTTPCASIPMDPSNSRPLITSQMKADCIGEFEFTIDGECGECIDTGADEDCEVCQGGIQYERRVTVPWVTCKQIYKRMAESAISNTPETKQTDTTLTVTGAELESRLETFMLEILADIQGRLKQRSEQIDDRVYLKWAESVIDKLDPNGTGMVAEDLAKEAMALPNPSTQQRVPEAAIRLMNLLGQKLDECFGYGDEDIEGLLDEWREFNSDAALTTTPQPESRLAIPRDVAEAKGMYLVGYSWLKHNAPDELTTRQAGGVLEGYTPVRTLALKWLLGETEAFEPVAGERGQFWWRSRLRDAILPGAHQPPQEGE